MARREDLDPFRKAVAAELDETRPNRYTVADTTGETSADVEDVDDEEVATSHIDAAADKWTHLLPPDAETVSIMARAEARRIEGNRTRLAHKLLREIEETRQPALGWLDMDSMPVAIRTRVEEEGRVRVRDERVALRAMTPIDFDRFVAEERRRNAHEFAERERAVQGAEWVGESMRKAGAENFRKWVRSVAGGTDEP